MATSEVVDLNAPHKPHENAIEAFHHVRHHIDAAIKKSRHDWNIHEPKMWSRADGLSDEELTAFDLKKDLVLCRSGATSYGTIIFGKIRIPAVHDEEGEGFVHVRIHDPHNRETHQVLFHSIYTAELDKTADGHPTGWRAIQLSDTPLEFFNE